MSDLKLKVADVPSCCVKHLVIASFISQKLQRFPVLCMESPISAYWPRFSQWKLPNFSIRISMFSRSTSCLTVCLFVSSSLCFATPDRSSKNGEWGPREWIVPKFPKGRLAFFFEHGKPSMNPIITSPQCNVKCPCLITFRMFIIIFVCLLMSKHVFILWFYM